MDRLRRTLAPILDQAWTLIDDEARRVLRANLSGRRVVDVNGPLGPTVAAINLGHAHPIATDGHDGVQVKRRQALELVDVRVEFELDRQGLDDVARGAVDPDLSSLLEAAKRVARFEEHAIYRGFAAGGIVGLQDAVEHPVLTLSDDGADYPDRVAAAIQLLQGVGVEGPYALVLGASPYRSLMGDGTGYPLAKQVVQSIGGPLVYAPTVEGGYLLAQRGGDFALTLGEDLAIGYQSHDEGRVKLYIHESFTFRVLTPEAAVRFGT